MADWQLSGLRPDHSNGMVYSRSPSDDMQQVAPTKGIPVCNKFQQQVTSVCLTSPRLPSLGIGCTQSVLGGSAFQPVSFLGKMVVKLRDSPCRRIIRIAPGGPTYLGSRIWWLCQKNPTVPALSAYPTISLQKSAKPKSPCLAS